MEKFKSSEVDIHLISRALIIQGENIVLCKAKGKDWYFLPGGHVENGESSKNCLFRELDEEMGLIINEAIFIGACETIFLIEEETIKHEINMVFKVEIPEDFIISSKEDELDFVIIKREEFQDYNILPEKIRDGIREWMETETPFFRGIQ
jgi:ADP-ribose pyrophosphatase YjhB (NUDIX family)